MRIKKYLDKLESFKNREIIVTGGTSGIGLSIVDHLLYKEAKVVVLARSITKSVDLKNKMEAKYPNCDLSFIYYDQDDLKSIDEAIKKIKAYHHSFYAIIFNAGIFSRKQQPGELSITMRTNLVGTSYFVKKLSEEVEGSHRFILQGSFVAGLRNKKIVSLNQKTSPFNQYILSKSGIEALYYHYANNKKSNISFYLIEPGLSSTNIIRNFPVVIKQLGKAFLKIFAHSNKKAALTAILALQTNISPCFIVPRSPFATRGYPKIKPFPKRRNRENLLTLLNSYI